MHIVWKNVILCFVYHYFALEGLYYMITLSVKWQTIIWCIYTSFQGIYAGAHRLCTHRCYKAKLPLRILLCLLQTITFQGSVCHWARNKYYVVLAITFCFVFPTLVPWYFWNEDLYLAFTTAGALRFLLTTHNTCLVNSVAHMWGTKPYDKDIKPVENRWISLLTQGEGWHNYHHSFPYDYRTGEVDSWNGNLTTSFIDLMAKVGWAYGLKTAPREIVQRKKKITGVEY